MIVDFLEENFFYLHPGYTTFNTIIFGVVLGLIILVILKLFKKINKNPEEIMLYLIPIIFFGSSSRALTDNHIYPRIHLLATPGIYISIGIMTILLLLLSIYFEKKTSYKYTKIILTFGILINIPNIIILFNNYINFKILFIELLLSSIISSPFILIKNNNEFLNNTNLTVLIAHIFDATTTFIAVDFFNYTEQHVLPTLLINITHTALVMYPLKIIIILVILYIIDYQIKDETLNSLLKLSIFILGLAPGIRNCLTLIINII